MPSWGTPFYLRCAATARATIPRTPAGWVLARGLAVRSGGAGGSASPPARWATWGGVVPCRVIDSPEYADPVRGDEHRTAGSASGAPCGADVVGGEWGSACRVGHGGSRALGFVCAGTDGGCAPACGVGWSDRVQEEGRGKAECERVARNMHGLGACETCKLVVAFWGCDVMDGQH